MNKFEKQALHQILKNLQNPSAPGAAYDDNFKPIKVEEVVKGTPNEKLLDNDFYRAGWLRCYEQAEQYLLFLLTAKNEDFIRFAGKPKK